MIRKRRSADSREIHAHDAMLTNTCSPRDAPRGIELGGMPLPVLDGQRITLESLRTGDRERRRRIESTG
jgi:hypothetical protein